MLVFLFFLIDALGLSLLFWVLWLVNWDVVGDIFVYAAVYSVGLNIKWGTFGI